MLATIPPLTPPTGSDAVGLLPEFVCGGGFVLLMLLDLVVPASWRGWLAAFATLDLLAAAGVVVWSWFDASTPREVYFDAFAYDRFGLFIDGLLIVAALLVVLISPGYLNRRGMHYGEYYALILASTTGMMLLASASSLMVVFLGVELLSLALYVLSGFARTEERSQEAALKYLLLGGFASGFLLYGMALVYGETGHTQFPLIGTAIHSMTGTDPLLVVGVIMIFIGLAFKVSAAPFHTWTPDVYEGAPTSVTTFMSVATKVAAFAAMIRLFSYTFPLLYSDWSRVVAFVAILSMVVGNVAALSQTSVKRMLAYSGIAQAGYILIGVAVSSISPAGNGFNFSGSGTVGILFYLAAYTLANLGAFAVITVMAGRGEDLDKYSSIRGLAYRRPYVAAAMGLFMLSLAGFPPAAGFFGKFLIFQAAIQGGQTSLAIWGIVTSAVSVFYYLRVGLLMYQRPQADEPRYMWSRTSVGGGVVLAATTAGTVVFGIFVALIYNLATSAQSGMVPFIH